ncbi:glycine--tRNA ligase [Candidatus Gracilibacteria bacterium CG2_30_37_12]|nr:MAG: glycine--tRNA ligase [Candidatus Gracilibacteria bacterium CG2_30_37_12]
MVNVEMKDLVSFASTRGFVYQGSEIYGGLANAWDYGPIGSALKENLKNAWLKNFVQERPDMVSLDAAILMNPNVWVTSGHVGGFSDPLMDCKSCKQRLRADKLIEEYMEKSGDIEVPVEWAGESTPPENLTTYIAQKNIKCPYCGKNDFSDIKKFNLMFRTFQGVTEDSSATVYLRPETAQGIFINFQNIVRTSRKKVPFGVAQVGKAFRNEITPGNFIFRTREFEQMEIEFFCEPESIAPGKHLEHHAKWKSDCMNFLTKTIGIQPESLRFRDHGADELSFYSAATTDIEFKFPFGWGELWGIADRTDYDLNAHMKETKQDLAYFDPFTNTKYVPYVIEPSLGLNRLFLTTLLNAYTEIEMEEGSRIVMKFAPAIAPIKIAVLPLVKKLGAEAMEIYKLLSPHFMCEYDEAGAIGKRYYRMDEIGVPFSVCVDSDNYNQGQLTIRDRDTGLQETIKIENLVEYFRSKGC